MAGMAVFFLRYLGLIRKVEDFMKRVRRKILRQYDFQS